MNDPIAIVLGLASLGYGFKLIKFDKDKVGWYFIFFAICFFTFEYRYADKNMHTSNNAIDGPDGISRMYANKIPINEQLIPHICVPIRVDLNERPILLAVKTGIINNAETRIIPNSFTPQMRAIDVPIKRKYLLNVTGKLITYANSV